MPISMYHASVPVFLQLLGGLKGFIEKGEAEATAKKWDPDVVLNLRLYPDMFTLARQVRQASEHAFGAGRAAGVEVPNLYFHITTAYNILRSLGVGIGKRDFMGQMPS